MTKKWKLRGGALISVLGFSAAAVIICARVTWITEHSGQVVARMPPCTADWKQCQHFALLHMSEALNKYPNANQYQVRWCRHWVARDETDYFAVTYDRRTQELSETNVGVADMDYCSRVTGKAINDASKTSGGFEALAKYGADYKPL